MKVQLDAELAESQLAATSQTVYLTQKIIRETIKVEKKKMDQDGILTNSRVNGTLTIWLVPLGNS